MGCDLKRPLDKVHHTDSKTTDRPGKQYLPDAEAATSKLTRMNLVMVAEEVGKGCTGGGVGRVTDGFRGRMTKGQGSSLCFRRGVSSKSTGVRIRLSQTTEGEQAESKRHKTDTQQQGMHLGWAGRVVTALCPTFQTYDLMACFRPASPLCFRNIEGDGREKFSNTRW